MNLYKHPQGEIKFYKMSEIENKIENENKDKGETKMCSLCHKSIDSDLQMKLPCNKHFIHKEDCAFQWLLKKKSCSPCARAEKERKERLKKERNCVTKKWCRNPINAYCSDTRTRTNDIHGKRLKRHIPSKISPELLKFFEKDYNKELANYNKNPASTHWLLQWFIPAGPEKDFDKQMSRHDVGQKIEKYVLDHHLYSKGRILVDKDPRLRKLLGYPKKKDKKKYLTNFNMIYYIEKHFIED
jgi:hypothetical protein